MKNINILIILLLSVWGVLAGYFAFNDLSFSNTIVNPQSGWAVFFEQYGEIPGAVVILSGIMIYSAQLESSSTLKLMLLQTVLMLSLSGILLYLSYLVLFNITESEKSFLLVSPFLFIAFLILNILSVLLLRKIRIKFSANLKIISNIIVGTAFWGYIIFIQFVKFIWGRVRFRDLDLLQSNFTEWYVVNGINGHQSFPSGHAAMGWMLLPVFLLVIDKNVLIKSFSIWLIIIVAAVISVSRIVIGAHYGSDVIFGSFVIIITFLLLYKKYYYNPERVNKVSA